MNLRKQLFKTHRWLGLIVSLQLLAWSLGGLYFSLFDIQTIRGSTDSAQREPEPIAIPEAAVTVSEAIVTAESAGISADQIFDVILLTRRGQLVWEIRDEHHAPLALVSITDGHLLPMVTEEQARDIARADFIHPAAILSSRLIEDEPPGEFRGGRLPAWRVDLDNNRRIHLYIDAINGQVLARRNQLWRVFDFFWMLHIMDYEDREDFHHPLLIGASALAVLTSLTGIALWGWRFSSFLHRRRNSTDVTG